MSRRSGKTMLILADPDAQLSNISSFNFYIL
jgi:hypothetical protein